MPQGKKNSYRCQTCGGFIITLDVDEGTTPFMLLCRATPGCKGFMYSSFYSCPQSFQHSYEFFKPVSLEGYDADMLEHFRKGGLDFRKVGGESIFKEPVKPKRKRARKP